jgi:hypothetical protein
VAVGPFFDKLGIPWIATVLLCLALPWTMRRRLTRSIASLRAACRITDWKTII